jgi:hypothetical protein
MIADAQATAHKARSSLATEPRSGNRTRSTSHRDPLDIAGDCMSRKRFRTGNRAERAPPAWAAVPGTTRARGKPREDVLLELGSRAVGPVIGARETGCRRSVSSARADPCTPKARVVFSGDRRDERAEAVRAASCGRAVPLLGKPGEKRGILHASRPVHRG